MSVLQSHTDRMAALNRCKDDWSRLGIMWAFLSLDGKPVTLEVARQRLLKLQRSLG